MKRLVCEICGGVSLIKKDGVFECQNCGCQYTYEEAKKLIVEGHVDVSGSVVIIDHNQELQNLYLLARRARTNHEDRYAHEYYERILTKDPTSWEAILYTTYYRSMSCPIDAIGNASIQVCNTSKIILNNIKVQSFSQDEIKNNVSEAAAQLRAISNYFFNTYRNYYVSLQNARYLQYYLANCSSARDISYRIGDYIIELFGDDYDYIACSCWELGIEQHNILLPLFKNTRANKERDKNTEKILSYISKVKKYKPFYQAPSINRSFWFG